MRVWAPGKRGYGYGYEIVYPHQTRTLEAGVRVRSAVRHRSLKWQIAFLPPPHLGLGTSALAGDPDPYPRVFGRQMSHPDP